MEAFSDAGDAAVAASLMAVGAASKLLDLEGDELRIDLTPAEVIQARSSSRRGLIAANAAAAAFLVIFLLVQLLARTTDAMNHRIEQNRLESQLHTMPARVARRPIRRRRDRTHDEGTGEPGCGPHAARGGLVGRAAVRSARRPRRASA